MVHGEEEDVGVGVGVGLLVSSLTCSSSPP